MISWLKAFDVVDEGDAVIVTVTIEKALEIPMWEITDPESKTLHKVRSEQDAKQWAKEKWPDCFIDGEINRASDRIYIYDKDENHVGYIEAPLSHFNELDED